ncbi:MAG: hypothetical protein KKE09_06545, partial [Bacteroidetes bacterium]|nr:hypothetical protein [Bacteroidota bacterium]
KLGFLNCKVWILEIKIWILFGFCGLPFSLSAPNLYKTKTMDFKSMYKKSPTFTNENRKAQLFKKVGLFKPQSFDIRI